MKHLKKFSLYTLVGFFGAGVNFLLMPYLSHFIVPEGYGLLSMVLSFISLLIPLVSLVANGLINVEYFKIKDKKEFASFFSSIQLIPVAPALLVLLVALLFPDSIARLFEIPADKSYWMPLSVIIASLSIYFETLLAYAITAQNTSGFSLFYILKTIVDVALTIVFVSILRMGWEGRLYAYLITTIAFFFTSLFYFRKQQLLTLHIQWKYVQMGLLFGLPLIMHTVGKFVINQSDRIFIAKMVSLEEAGIYNIGYQVGTVLLLLVNAASNFYTPFLYERLSNLTELTRREIVKYSYIITCILLVALVGLTIFAPMFFAWLVDPKYSSGTAYVFWIGLSYFFWGVYSIFSSFIFYKRKTKFLGYLAILNVLLNITLNYLLIQYYGALGAAYATSISFFVVAFIVGWRAVSMVQLPWLYLFRSTKKVTTV